MAEDKNPDTEELELTEEEMNAQDNVANKPEATTPPAKKEVVSKEELDALYKEVVGKPGKDEEVNPEEIARRAVEAYRQKEAVKAQREQDQQEQQALKAKLEDMEQQLQAIKDQPSGRRSKAANSNNPFEKTEQGKVKIPAQDFDDAMKKFLRVGR